MFPLVILIRTAQFAISCFFTLISLLFSNDMNNSATNWISSTILELGIAIIVEITDFYRWLMWISGYFKIKLVQKWFGYTYTILFLFSHSIYNTTHQTKCKHRNKHRHISSMAHDERLMILSAVQIYADLVFQFCNPFHTWETWVLLMYRFKTKNISRIMENNI